MSVIPKHLPRLCVALGISNVDSLQKAAEAEVKDGNSFLEFRLDYLPRPSDALALIKRLRESEPGLYLLATCRHRSVGGSYAGTVSDQVSVLRAAAAAGAQLVDLEIERAENARAFDDLRESASLIISYHNFESTPNLNAVYRRLSKVPADGYKIVTTARKPTDNLRVLEFAREKRAAPLTIFAMSELGLASRILSLASGCPFTYTAPAEMAGTAPGQIPARTMRTLYRADKLSRHSRIFGVIADPVAHSKSPQIHNRAFQAKRIDAAYLPFRVESRHLGDWMVFADKLPISGFSVTIPHKRRILRYLDSIDPLARRIGAVNTVWKKNGKWRGANTDIAGILRPLQHQTRLSKASLLLIGYGGAARAAAIALSDAGAHVTVTGRDGKQAHQLAKLVNGKSLSLPDAEQETFDIVLNATPVGMYPNINDCVFDHRIPGKVVFDMVYNPSETALLHRAKEQGCAVISGCEMFVEQAAEQFEIWTGETAPRSLMRQAIEA